MADHPVHVLVVDDEPSIQRFLLAVLTGHGYDVFQAVNGQDAISAIKDQRPDIVILDLGLPDVDGVTVTQVIREWSSIPIIALTVRDAESDKVSALDAGADDYVTKPFGTGELLARLRAALRRATQTSDEPVFASGGLKVDLPHRQVQVDGHDVQLTPTEYDLLRVLVQNAGKVMTHRQLLREVWGAAYDREVHMLRVNLSNLRRKVEPEPARPRYILTEPGVGYRLRSPEKSSDD
jgi:two-component system KDP operon response regulator KdpE